jgi:hypothetical protein
MATSTPAAKSRPLATLEARARHVLLMIGFGFASYVLGAIFSSFLLIRLQDRVEVLGATPRALVASLVEHFWILLTWPVVANGLTRIFPLSPWPLALIGAATGEAFNIGIAVASRGFDEAFAQGLQLWLHVALMGAGVVLTAWAATRGKASAARAELLAQQKAEAKKGEYDEFVKAAEAIAARTESKDAAGQGAPAQPVETAPAPAVSPGMTEPAPAIVSITTEQPHAVAPVAASAGAVDAPPAVPIKPE